MKVEEINPYNQSEDKSLQVEQMFNSIAPKYDFMNSAMSLGLHKMWRNQALKAAIEKLPDKEDLKVLDIATGTGDVAFKVHQILPEAEITGIDLSEGMLEIARHKLSLLSKKEQSLIAFGKGDSLSMPFHDNAFDMVTVAYGVRNFSDLSKGLDEMRRVLSLDGVLCIIELSTPQGILSKPLYNFYSGRIIPWMGKMVSGDNRAYSYLPESIKACPQGNEMALLLRSRGFKQVKWKSLSFGAVTYYLAK